MTNPITPPPKLVQKWIKSARYREFMPYPEGYEQYEQRLTTIAARWGADMELEACVEWLGDAPVVYDDNGDFHPGSYLRDARRSKLLSLKEQALKVLKNAPGQDHPSPVSVLTADEHALIRRALEQLND